MKLEAVAEHLVLLVTAKQGAENLGAALSKSAEVVVEIARSKRAALAVLRRQQFAVVIVDSALPATEVTKTDMLWQNSNSAAPLEIDLGALGAASLARLLRSVLESRRHSENTLRENVKQTMSEDLRSTLTGLLLQSDLALKEKALTPAVEHRVRELRALADDLRVRYRPAY